MVDVSNVVYWTLRILVIIPVYQILLIVIGTGFGEFSYFGKWRKDVFSIQEKVLDGVF